MVGLEALPLPARDEVVQLLCPRYSHLYRGFRPTDEGFLALPFISKGTLAALKELRLPLGLLRRVSIEEAVEQAHALRRAWNLGTFDLSGSPLTDVSALAGFATLHTLDLSLCQQLTDVSALAGCAALHTLFLNACNGVTDVSALGGCAKLHTLDLTGCRNVTNVSALAGCAALRTLELAGSRCARLNSLAR